jgi:hypothetical protein
VLLLRAAHAGQKFEGIQKNVQKLKVLKGIMSL